MIEWLEEFCSGNEKTNREHHRLFEAVNELELMAGNEFSHEALDAAVDFLARYANWHFDLEMEAMFKNHSPALTAHCAAHQWLRQQVRQWEASLAEDGTPTLAKEIHWSASLWLQDHVTSNHDLCVLDQELVSA